MQDIPKHLLPENAPTFAEIRVMLAALSHSQVKNERLFTEVGKQMKKLQTELGGVGNALGYIFEDEVATKMKKTRKIDGVKLDYVTPDVRSVRGNQYDLVGLNGKFVYLMEAKQTLKRTDITTFVAKTMPAFKRDYPAEVKGRELKGAFFYRNLGGKNQAQMQKVASAALERGILLIRVVGTNTLHPIKTLKTLPTPTQSLKK